MPGTDGSRRSGFRGLIDRLTRSEEELDAAELQEDTGRLGRVPISQLADRQVASVCGNVHSVTLRPRVTVPALVVDLYDGSRTLSLVWLGRRRIAGIEPGTYITARGRVTYLRGVPTIFNPAYEIIPDRPSASNDRLADRGVGSLDRRGPAEPAGTGVRPPAGEAGG